MPGIVGIPKAVPLSNGSQELFAPVLNKYRNSEKVFQDFYSNLTDILYLLPVESNNKNWGLYFMCVFKFYFFLIIFYCILQKN